MRNKYIIFFLFIALLYVVFMRVDFSYKAPIEENKPNFVLLDANIEHFLQGKLGFHIKAKKIEIFDKIFVMYESTINSEEGMLISANIMEYYLDTDLIHASSNVHFQRANQVYSGNELEYDMKRLLLKTYGGGEFTLK